jgi:hypothetical protein
MRRREFLRNLVEDTLNKHLCGFWLSELNEWAGQAGEANLALSEWPNLAGRSLL